MFREGSKWAVYDIGNNHICGNLETRDLAEMITGILDAVYIQGAEAGAERQRQAFRKVIGIDG